MNKLLSFVQSFKSYLIDWIMLCCLSSSFRVVLDFSGTRFKWIESHVTGRLLGVHFVQRYEVGYLRAFVLVLEFNRNFSSRAFTVHSPYK